MKINSIITSKLLSFQGKREDRNTTNQLAKDNKYSLTDNNRSRIEKAIENLSNESGENNVKFLLDVAKNLKYGTNIDTGISPNVDWKTKLKDAAKKSLAVSDPIVKEKYTPELKEIFDTKKPLSLDEKDILNEKALLLSNIDKSQLEECKNKNITNIEGNLNYLIASNDIPTKQKKYILNRLNYLLSPEYKINPQLVDKKTLVLAEMLNDLVVNAQTTDVPNTKAINQKRHGMCAAISIARKLMSYEYKTDYVDSLLSELDDSPTMQVYDLAHLDSGKKVPIEKADVKYLDALDKGYRIVDAATTNWMNAADMYGMDYRSENVYTPFDDVYFGTFEDSHYMTLLEDSDYEAKHAYYQTLLKAKESIFDAKSSKINRNLDYSAQMSHLDSNLNMLGELKSSMGAELKKIIPSLQNADIVKTVSEIIALQTKYSSNIDKLPEKARKYHFIPNEEETVKQNKIKSFLTDSYPGKVNKEALDAGVENIVDILELSVSLSQSIKPSNTITSKIADDRKLFNAAAAYRTAMMFALNDSDYKLNYMVHFNIPDEESLTLNTFDEIMNHIEQTSDPRYLEHFGRVFGVGTDKKRILANLAIVKTTAALSLKQTMDQFFEILGIGDRKKALLNQVKSIKFEIENGSKEELKNSSVTMGVEPNKSKILKILNGYVKTLESNPTEEEYTEIFNKTGNKSILNSFANEFRALNEAMKFPEVEYNAELIRKFNIANGIDEDSPLEYSNAILNSIANKFNSLSVNISTIKDTLTIVDDNGNILSTANPKAIILKKMENEGTIVSTKELWNLKNRYNAIDKLRSQDEFSSRQGKISDPALYKYTLAEKETLKKIKKNLNYMASEVNKELSTTYSEIKKPLEEHARQIGVNTGNFWNTQDGHSGLNSHQMTKILQELTGKPYQAVSDLNKAVEIIKNSPHSGVSSSSVFHDKPGWHAQYIAEIAEKDGKEILFHDNTWGASEHENVWVDSKGLTRTDYSDKRGGELGYITDKNWRNGNYLNNLFYKTGQNKPKPVDSKMLKKIKDNDEEYKFPLMNNIILPGVSEEANNIAASIKDSIFIPDSAFVKDLNKLASKMTVEEIKAARIKSKTAGKFYKKELENIEKRLEVTPLNKGITTKEEYDALGDNDVLKVTFEKAAVELSYDYVSSWKELAKIDTVSGLKKIRSKQKKDARENFDYAFSKSPLILYAYATNKNKTHLLPILEKALADNNIKIDEKKKIEIIKHTAEYGNEKHKFDGSLKNTIDFMVGNVLRQFDENVPRSEASEAAKAQIKRELTKDIENALYFNAHDLEKSTEKLNAIKNYIDKKYNPETDEEFIKIFRKLQDMTTEEFKKETSDASDADFALKNISGFELLKKYNASNEKIQTVVANLVFQKHLLRDINLTDTAPVFRYKKLEPKARGAYYKDSRTFDDLYRNFKFSLQGLTYEKMFNKYKDINYRKYGAIPAYPKINVITDSKIAEMTDRFDKFVYDAIDTIRNKKINLMVYSLTNKVDELLNSVADNSKLTQKQLSLLYSIAGEFITMNDSDEAIPQSVNAAYNILELGKNTTAGEFKKYFEPWKKETGGIQRMNPVEVVQESIKEDFENLKDFINLVIDANFPVRYRSVMRADVNSWLNEELNFEESPYDKTLSSRSLEKKIETSALPGFSQSDKTTFINELSSGILNLKKTKLRMDNNNDTKSTAFVQIMNTCSAVNYKFVPESAHLEFSSDISDFSDAETKLSREEIEDFIIRKINKYKTTETSKLHEDKDVKKLVRAVAKYNSSLTDSQKYSDELEKERQKFKKTILKFLAAKIKPDYRDAVAQKIKEFVDLGFKKSDTDRKSEDKAALAHQKFIADYRRYHLLNSPEEILDRYLELTAKDSPVKREKNENVKTRLEAEQNQLESYLNLALSISSLVDIQENLMSAAQLGNPALVTSKFKNFDTTLIDVSGNFASLADDEAVDHMVRRMIIEGDDSTAVLFVEKLGLTEKFLRIENEVLDFDIYKKEIDKIGRLIRNANKQIGAFDKELQNFDVAFDNDKNYAQKIDDAKNNLLKNTKNTREKNNIKSMLTMFEQAKTIIDSNDDISKHMIIKEGSNIIKREIIKNINAKLTELQSILKEVSMIQNMILKLNTPPDSEEEKLKQKILDTYEKIEDYNEKVLLGAIQNSEYLSVTTKNM